MRTAITAVVMAVGMIAAVSGRDVRPAKEYTTVMFRDPVKVLSNVLMGKYLIEHDTERMARGEPCTYIYRWSDRRKPVVTFHCLHLTRAQAGSATVTLRRATDMGNTRGFTMTEFQFAGSGDAHGVPVRR